MFLRNNHGAREHIIWTRRRRRYRQLIDNSIAKNTHIMPYIQADVAYHTPLQLPRCITTILTCTDQFSAFLISTRSHVDLVLVSTAFTHPLRSSRKEPPNGSGSAIIGGECNNLASVPFQCPIDCRLLIFFLHNSNSNTKLKLNRSETQVELQPFFL